MTQQDTDLRKLFSYTNMKYVDFDKLLSEGTNTQFTYNDLVITANPEVKWLILGEQYLKSGDLLYFGKDFYGNYYIAVIKGNSLDLERGLLHLNTYEKIVDMFETIKPKIIKLESLEDLTAYVIKELYKVEYGYRHWVEFLTTMYYKTGDALTVHTIEYKPELNMVKDIFEGKKLREVYQKLIAMLKLFPQIDLTEIEYYPEWLSVINFRVPVKNMTVETLEKDFGYQVPSYNPLSREQILHNFMMWEVKELFESLGNNVKSISIESPGSVYVEMYSVAKGESEYIEKVLVEELSMDKWWDGYQIKVSLDSVISRNYTHISKEPIYLGDEEVGKTDAGFYYTFKDFKRSVGV